MIDNPIILKNKFSQMLLSYAEDSKTFKQVRETMSEVFKLY